ncbi:MAG TPA: VOC family protein [Chitinophagaceae bacterium]|jgi:catechol 2,3-dioxygenase-like lactoylglutathione lyase family enzyme|nr:VOC family protein [Chitinophagaceae bacterium]
MKKAKTYGLTHIAIAVKDLDKTLRFYQKVFEVEVMYHKDDFLQVTTPGANDIIVFEKKKADYGKTGGIAHFGFRLRKAGDIDEMAKRIKSAGGTILDKGEFVPGEPYIFFKDPDGYEVEVCYELIGE